MALLDAMVLGFTRSIGDSKGQAIIPNVVVSELHVDDVTATRHPVDIGANISDHAYREPATLVCEFAWSDSSMLLNSMIDGSLFRGLRSSNDVYEKLLALKDQLQLLTVTTGKRTYKNMLIVQLKTTTTEDTENCLKMEITFQEVLTVSAKEVRLKINNQASPSRTATAAARGSIPTVVAELNKGGYR